MSARRFGVNRGGCGLEPRGEGGAPFGASPRVVVTEVRSRGASERGYRQRSTRTSLVRERPRPTLRMLTGTLVLAVILALGRAGVAAPTVVTTWHPFDASGAVKPSLKLDYRGRGGCSPVSEAIGYFGYR